MLTNRLGMAIARFRRPVLGSIYDSAQIGDEIGGGIYLGKHIYGDGREFNYIVMPAADITTREWSTVRPVTTSATDRDDGVANTDQILATSGTFPMAEFCASYVSDGFSDFYLPATDELAFMIPVMAGLSDYINAIPDTTSLTASTEASSNNMYRRAWTENTETDVYKTYTLWFVAVRRVPV